MWGAVIGDMVGSQFAGKLNTNFRFELPEHIGGYTVNTALITALADLLYYEMPPAKGKIARALAAREIGGQQKKYITRSSTPLDDQRKKWISYSGLNRCTAAAAFSPLLALPFAYAYDDVDDVVSQSELACAYISDCEESRTAAKAAAVIVFSLRNGIDKRELSEICEPFCGFALDIEYQEAQELLLSGGGPREFIKGAAAALVKSYDIDSAIRFAAALGREPQTICALAGAMAEAYYGKLPKELIDKVAKMLEPGQLKSLERFTAKI